ncbi:MAG TPA: hypothetical protein VM582_02730 [Candidatus Thermoplasmatota archaeon]|nr:hypothetical protein [Candidatus Thermoplasmatota archaeon]
MRRLLDEGYELVEVESEQGLVEATFGRYGQRVTIQFLPAEAEALLLAKGPLRLPR